MTTVREIPEINANPHLQCGYGAMVQRCSSSSSVSSATRALAKATPWGPLGVLPVSRANHLQTILLGTFCVASQTLGAISLARSLLLFCIFSTLIYNRSLNIEAASLCLPAVFGQGKHDLRRTLSKVKSFSPSTRNIRRVIRASIR
jgi:hypothetical protein